MNLIGRTLQHKAWSIAFWLLISAIGIISYLSMPIDLFPDVTPPQVVTMTMVRGASAEDVSRKVTTLVDRELKGLTGIKKVVSTSRDEVSSVNAQFEYGTDVSAAMTDVINAVNRVRSRFPAGSQEPQYFRVTDATRPIMTVSVAPAASFSFDLKAIRLLAENDLKEEFLRQPGIGRVDVFGANDPEVLIRFDLERLRIFRLPPAQVLQKIGAQNVSLPGGYYECGGRESLVKTLSEAFNPEQLYDMPVAVRNGAIIRLADVASVSLSIRTRRSIYHGNGEPAIAMNILKPEDGYAVQGLFYGKKLVKQLEMQYPELKFAITTDQEPIITINVAGMKGALFSAVWMTMLIVFIFLIEIRTSLVIGVSIPLSFLTAFAFLNFTPFTINMVTLSGLIIAVGMVVDAAIVVVENVFRHLREKESSLATIAHGTEEVVFSVLGGMLTTIVVMIPIMFVGGYPQQVLRPLTMTISATLVGSFLAAVSIVPILLGYFFVGHRPDDDKNSFLVKLNEKVEVALNFVAEIYLSLLRLFQKIRLPVLIGCFILLVVTVRTVIPTIGRELMPRMDTGQIIIKADLPASMTPEQVELAINKVEKVIKSNPHVLTISTVAGSEPGQVSFGAGGQLLQQLEIQVRLTTRDQRQETIWEINRSWRHEFSRIPELVAFSVTEFGATPLSTTRAPIDVMISGRDPETLYQLAGKLDADLRSIKGLNDLRFSWSKSKPEIHFLPDLEFTNRYNVSPVEIGEFLATTFTGRTPTYLKLNGFVDIPVRAELGINQQTWKRPLEELALTREGGELFLSSLGRTMPVLKPTLVTRENLRETIDILGINSNLPLSTVAAEVQKKIDGFPLPAGYQIELSGSMSDMTETGIRLGKALFIGIIMLYIVLYLLFECWWRPFLVMAAIPLSLIGAFWGLVILDKPMCMPAMMGIILLGGTIVNNAIILIDFIDNAIKEGCGRQQAMENSVRIRLRPILITTLSTVIGLMPLTFEQAVGLERMSPLGAVASFGLLAGTIMTMVIIPLAYDFVSDIKDRFQNSSS
ncbi:MAG: efflux RND transporter permease subunit [Candidatus Rifleibacteriota bacterium]